MFTADSHFWYLRTQNFIESVKTHKWAETYQNPKPGVTIMWLSGISMDAYFNYYRSKHNFVPYIFSSDIFPRLDFIVKTPLVILCLLSVLGLYLLIRNVVDENTAFFSVVFLAFQPFYVGVSRFFHGDGTLTAFMTASVCLLFYYVFKGRKKLVLILCAVTGGLAFLTKMQAVYLIPYTYLILLVSTYAEKRKLVDLLKDGFLWTGIFVITIFVLFPALWVKPVVTLSDMYREATIATESGVETSYDSLYIGQLVRIFTPISILFFLAGLVFFFSKVKNQLKDKNLFSTYCFLFILFYLIQMQIIDKKSSRYLLPLFPFVSIFCAYGFLNTVQKINTKMVRIVLSFILVMYLILNIASYAPHYTAMTETAPWGSLSYEAANYLNQKKKAHLLNVLFTPKQQTFRPFFKGTTYGKGETLPERATIDYLVVSKEADIPKGYDQCKYEYSIVFKGREFWRIYSCDK